jgi:hypothetical protein
VATSPPEITPAGTTVKAGETLRVGSLGTWSDPAAALSWAWTSCGDGGCQLRQIGGQTYTVPAAEVGRMIRLDVAASTATANGSAVSSTRLVLTAAGVLPLGGSGGPLTGGGDALPSAGTGGSSAASFAVSALAALKKLKAKALAKSGRAALGSFQAGRAGKLTITGKLKKVSAGTSSVSFPAAGRKPVVLTITPAGRKALRRSGRKTLALTLTWAPAGGPAETVKKSVALR